MDADVLKEFVEAERRKKPSIGQLEHMFELIRKGALTGAKLQRFMESLGQFEASRLTFLSSTKNVYRQPTYEQLQDKFYSVHPSYKYANFEQIPSCRALLEVLPENTRMKYAFIERDVYSAEEAIEEMKKHGFRPALYGELVGFVPDRETLERMEARRFIALSSYWMDDGVRRFPVLEKMYSGSDAWCLALATLGNGAGPLPEDMAFLMVEI